MRIYNYIDLVDFEFWSGAKTLASKLTMEELDIIQEAMEDFHPEPWSAMEINDFFWFDDEAIAIILGYWDAEEMWQHLNTRNLY